MKPEYLFKVGNLFLCTIHDWSSKLELTEKQHEAGRYDLEVAHKRETYLKLHKIPYTCFNVNGPLTVVDTLPLLEVKKKETV